MPCFDVAADLDKKNYIKCSLASILGQTYEDWELVIVDDCSTDMTVDAINDFTDKNLSSIKGRISVHYNREHSGRIGQLKNEAISKFRSKHDYICHVGSDDIIPDYCLKTFVDYMDKHPEIGACCGNFTCFDDKGNEWSFPHVANSGDYDSNILLRYMCLFPHRFYRRSVVEEAGGYSDELTSAVDYDLALRLDEITKIHRIKKPITYFYRQHSQQVSTRARPEQDANAKKALETALKRRGINGVVENNKMPFKIRNLEEEHFIWGGKSG